MASIHTIKPRSRLGRVALLLLAISCLVSGIWGGLLRVPLGLPLPVEHANWISFHGALMVCGFLGTVISLERAVGLRALWTFLAPLCAGAGGVVIAFGVLSPWPRWLLTVGSLVYVAVTLRIVQIQPNLSNSVMIVGAAAWTVGNALWALGYAIPQIVLWWLAFLLLVIVAERLELTRFQKPSPLSKPWLIITLVLLGLGLVMVGIQPRMGGVLTGAALLVMAGWLLRFDLAWRTIRHPGLPRFMAICLLSGHAWLTLTGILITLKWPQSSGITYDATLHSFFLGFVFSMIFGHAPVIFPAVLGLPVQYRWTAYLPLVALHLSLGLRLLGDLLGQADWRGWGAAGNAIAVALFLLNMALGFVLAGYASLQAKRKKRRQTKVTVG